MAESKDLLAVLWSGEDVLRDKMHDKLGKDDGGERMDYIKGIFRYNHAICITEELLKELDALYRNYFGEPEYKVKK